MVSEREESRYNRRSTMVWERKVFVCVCAAACEQCGVLREVCVSVFERAIHAFYLLSRLVERRPTCDHLLMRECGPRYFLSI